MAKSKGGRPSKYSGKLADEICQQLAEGKSLRTVCRASGMPHIATVFRWMRDIDGFREQYEMAKDETADMMSEDLLDIADDTEGDVQRDRLRIDARKWLASKLKPKRYGERQEVEHSGSLEFTFQLDE